MVMSARRPVSDQLPKELPPEVVRVEMTPGRVRQVAMPRGAAEGRRLYYEAFLEAAGPGVFREVRRIHRPMVKLTENTPELEGTGLTRRDVLTLLYAGMIRGARPGLQTTLIDIVSVWEHIERTALGPDGGEAAEFWQKPGNVRAFSEASQEIHARGLVPRDAHRAAMEMEAEAERGQGFLEF